LFQMLIAESFLQVKYFQAGDLVTYINVTHPTVYLLVEAVIP